MSENLFLGDVTYPHTKTPLQIRRELNDAKFDKFFDFPTSDKRQVSSVSCKLFVDHVLRESNDRIEQLEAQVQVREDAAKSALKDTNAMQEYAKTFRDIGAEQQARIEQLERELAAATIGHARYEYVRKLNLMQFIDIYVSSITGGIPFDDQVDAAIQEGK